MIKKMLHINGVPKTVIAESETMLADVLREQLKLTGTKVGCGQGQCGCCSVILDGKVVRSCITKMKRVEDGARRHHHRGHRHPRQPACPADGLDRARRRPVRLLQPGLHRFGQGPAGREPRAPRASRSGIGSRNTATPAAAPVTSRWWTRSWTRPRCCGARSTLKDLAFKLPADGRIWGTTYPRPSAVAKVTGTTDYGADLGLKMPPGTLQLALVQAKVSHAKILSIDTSEAEKMPGVVKGRHPQGRQRQEPHHRPDHLSYQQGRRLGPPDPLRSEGLSVRRRHRHRGCADTEENAGRPPRRSR